MKITEHQKLKICWEFWGTLKNISEDQGNIQQNFWEHGNLTRVNLREHLNLFFGEQGRNSNFFQGNKGTCTPPPPPGRPSPLASDTEADSIMTPTRPTIPTPMTSRISKYTSYTSKNLSGAPSKAVDRRYFVGTLYKADPYQLVRRQT